MADSAAQKKPGFIARAKKFFIVIVMVIIAAVFVGCLDLIAKGLLDLFVKLL